jgi:hypothetical protein
MSQLAKILILIVSFLPVLAIHVLALLLLSEPRGGRTWLDGHFGYLFASLVALQLAVVAFYIWHLKHRSVVPRKQHGSWVAKFIFTRGPFAFADYWHKHIWRVSRGAP